MKASKAVIAAAIFPVLLFASYGAVDSWLARKEYLTSTSEIAEIANTARHCCGGDPELMMANVTASLSARYPGLIDVDSPWIFMRAGGWMGSFKLLYSSLTEYVLLFGTAMDTSGHSGRYYADISDTLLSGRFVQWIEGQVHPVVHGPGATVLHPKFAATGVHWKEGTWMVEHATGLIPTTMGFAFSDGIFSSQDFWSLGKAFAVYAKQVGANLLRGRI